MRDVISNKTDVAARDLPSEGFARVELFTFVKEKNRWQFNRAYFEN